MMVIAVRGCLWSSSLVAVILTTWSSSSQATRLPASKTCLIRLSRSTG